ncbi:Rieske (2Fe-2S) protein [Zavarzinella formosa]|uniref:Rieske (2Fe-2S) protein n=1 Tax=Zavarzinella formosa TaxID=360055 RepID=UPI0002D9C9CA|nr:Rieske (2Fe-2S) protein [Zavarzinella formosa]
MSLTIERPTPYVPVCDLDALPVGLGRAFEIAGHEVAIFRNREGKVFASVNQCPHKQGPLADGMLAGDQIVCPFHAFRFHSDTGECDQQGVCEVEIFPVEIRGNQVRIALPVNP